MNTLDSDAALENALRLVAGVTDRAQAERVLPVLKKLEAAHDEAALLQEMFGGDDE